MSINQTHYEKAATEYFTNDQQGALNFQKYFAPNLLATLVAEMQSSLPSVVAARLAFGRLVAKGLKRSDGRTDDDDRRDRRDRSKANLDSVIAEIDAPPLTRDELDYFSGLGREQLSALYYGPDGDAVCDFAIRYNKAIREHMFRRPERFQNIETPVQTPVEQGETLSAQEYHNMRAVDVVRRLRDPKFKMLVDRLIQRGEI